MGNVDRIRTMHEQFNARQFDDVLAQAAEELVLTDHGRGMTLNGRDGFRGWLDGFVAMSSDIRLVDLQSIDGGEHVTAMFRAVGKQDGPMDPFPVSGREFTLDACEVWRFDADGNAVEGHNYSDGLGLLAQLGHIEAPSPA